jgi:hypothetical protein
MPENKYYKYIERQYLQKFFSLGEIRIGTLYDFQNTEKHGSEIGDHEEGVKSANKVINWTGGPESQPEFDRKFINVQAPNVRIENVLVRETTRSNNLFVYSVSGKYSLDIMKNMNPEYDACIEINSPRKFFQAIHRKMGETVTNSALGRCIYLDRHRPHDQQHEIHPVWLKEPRYEYQDEYRFVMETNIHDIKPLNIYCKNAARYCSVKYIA